jgi:hypothetical protein
MNSDSINNKCDRDDGRCADDGVYGNNDNIL